MFTSMKIPLNLNEKEAIAFLKKNKTLRYQHSLFGHSVESSATWKSLDNPKKFKLALEDKGPFQPWQQVCSLQPTQYQNKTIVNIAFYPSTSLVVIMIAALYAVIRFGAYNYGRPGFLPAIAIPTLFIIGMSLFWRFLATLHVQKIKEEILRSFEDQPKTNERKF